MVGFYITPPFDPTAWDGEYETLPNLVAGWLPDRGLFKDAGGTEPAGEGEAVLGWRDIANGALLPHSEGPPSVVIGGIATASSVNAYAAMGSPLAGSIVEAVVGSVPKEGGVEPISSAVMVDDLNAPSQQMMVTGNFEGLLATFMGDIAVVYDEAIIIHPEPPSYPVSLRVVGSNAELVNLNGVLGEQVGYAEPVVGVSAMMVYTAAEGADNIPLTPVLLFSEPLPTEIRTQLFNKLKNDFPAWS